MISKQICGCLSSVEIENPSITAKSELAVCVYSPTVLWSLLDDQRKTKKRAPVPPRDIWQLIGYWSITSSQSLLAFSATHLLIPLIELVTHIAT